MLVSYNWLKEYIKLTLSPTELAEKLNLAGLPVEKIIEKKSEVIGVVIGKILKIEKHPDADTLSYCDVDNGVEVLKVVCGAKNIKEGMTIALANVGASLPGGFKIKKSKIRGLESNGMICSEAELGLAKEAEGILVLDEKLYPTLGESFAPIKPDSIFSLEITPNRPDLLCLTGLARFISGILDLPFTFPSFEINPTLINNELDINKKLKVKILDADKCPRYMARLVEGITVAASPEWLKDKLLSMDIRPINNIVDITNLVMMECNQPLHAFDHNLIKDSTILVRTASAKEKIKALDGKDYEMTTTDLCIADSSGPIAIAGIMGGALFSIMPETKTVVIEAAYFQPASIRVTSRRLALSSDSAYRFERGIDPYSTQNALNRAAALMAELGHGKVSANFIDLFPVKPEKLNVKLRYTRLNQILGTTLEKEKIKALIKALSFETSTQDEDSITIIVPGYRPDITAEIDLIEDIAQVYGYNNIPTTLPRSGITAGKNVVSGIFNTSLSTILMSYGFSSVINYSFHNNKVLKSLGVDPETYTRISVPLLNPFNEEETHMKTTLLPDLIKNLITNHNNENETIHLFEISHVFPGKIADGYAHVPTLSAISYGQIVYPGFNKKEFSTDLYYLKTLITSIHTSLNTEKELKFIANPAVFDFFEYAADVIIGDKKIGVIGQLKKEILYNNHLKENAYMFELDLDYLASFKNEKIGYRPLSRFPAVKRDISIILKADIPQAQVEAIIKKDHKATIQFLHLYDIYKGKQVPEGHKSFTYSIFFQSDKKTFSEQEINKIMERIVSNLKTEINAELRS